MTLVNETGVGVSYWITSANQADCGELAVDGAVDLPQYDNQQNVTVSFIPLGGDAYFAVEWPTTQTDEQTEMALVAE